MSLPTSRPDLAVTLLRFGVRALRITASSVALVALLRQQWLAGAVFALAWLLIRGAPRVVPLLAEQPQAAGTETQAGPGSDRTPP